MTDLHCHILPGLDDGSESPAMSAEMARIAAAHGTDHIARATTRTSPPASCASGG